jgi:hypothetical protein
MTSTGFAQSVDEKGPYYNFIGRLVETVILPPDCGTFAFAVVHKYEVLKTNYEGYDRQYVLIIQTCPEFLKANFFQRGKVYNIDVTANSGVEFTYSMNNEYEKEDLPIFWTKKVKRTIRYK